MIRVVASAAAPQADLHSRRPGRRFRGGAAQLQLRQVLTSVTGAYPLSKPEAMVARAATLFDADGNLREEDTRVRGLVKVLIDWTQRLLR